MINPKLMSTAVAMALVLTMAKPTTGFAEYRGIAGGGVRAGGTYRPPGGFYRPAGPVVAAPAMGGFRGSAPVAQPGGGRAYGAYNSGGYNGGPYRGGDRDHDHDRGAFVAGAVAGAIIGGAVAAPGYGYYYGAPAYYAPGYYGDQYDDGGPAVAPAPAGDDAIAICMQTYSSYDPSSGTYVGNDGLQHSCP